MKIQNYSNHIRYYTAHHFVFYPVVIALLIISIIAACKSNENKLLWFVMAGTISLVGWLSFMVRQHYALGNQNRIARLELRFRYYVLTQKRFEEIEQRLSLKQLLALRFASDAELVALTERTLKENLSADDIKKSIKTWLPDYMRA